MELKPCPFCGGKAKLRSDERDSIVFWALCVACLVATSFYLTKEYAAEAWNTRADGEAELKLKAIIEWLGEEGVTEIIEEKFSDISALNSFIKHKKLNRENIIAISRTPGYVALYYEPVKKDPPKDGSF